MATRRRDRGVVGDLVVDLRRFHERWMGLLFPRQVGARGTVLGKWKPSTTAERAGYLAWGALGVPVVAVAYPLALVGAVLRFSTRRVDATAGRLGVLGVVTTMLVAWGGLSLLARSRFTVRGFLAVAAAGVVATLAAVLALAFRRIDGRPATVAFAYPLATTAIFLPPVVAALYSPVVAAVVLPTSQSLALWLLNGPLSLFGVAGFLQSTFRLVGFAYLAMWFAIAVPLGWVTGSLVTLADVVRPRE
jgi:hypothetical protein